MRRCSNQRKKVVSVVNIELLRSKIVQKKTNVSEIAVKMGIDKATLYRRIADSGSFTIGEAEKIAQILQLSRDEAVAIFFSESVA